jgi:hypothetical protein
MTAFAGALSALARSDVIGPGRELLRTNHSIHFSQPSSLTIPANAAVNFLSLCRADEKCLIMRIAEIE